MSCPYDVLDALQRSVSWLGVLVAVAAVVVVVGAVGVVWGWALLGGER